MTNDERTSEVQSLIERILQDTSVCQDTRLRLINAPEVTRKKLIEALRGRDVPILSTGGACGPG